MEGQRLIPGYASSVSAEELHLLEALRQWDETAFMMLVEQYQAALIRLARMYVSDPALAEEVVQETWLAVLRGLDRFEGRSSLKTWIFRILMNKARTRAVREGRTIPFAALESAVSESDGPSVDPDRFFPPDHPADSPRHWKSPPNEWDQTPEQMLLSGETLAYIDAAIQQLKPSQREVITLRDIQGLTAAEACEILGITDSNQRVLLHRARSNVRAALERWWDGREVA
jgi:RNA polymerase sigma-70 factor (ECF subfamily)